MKTSITSAQAMLHPTVVETFNALSELCRELREELETARADEREACAELCDGLADTHEKLSQWSSHKTADTLAQAIRARGTT